MDWDTFRYIQPVRIEKVNSRQVTITYAKVSLIGFENPVARQSLFTQISLLYPAIEKFVVGGEDPGDDYYYISFIGDIND